MSKNQRSLIEIIIAFLIARRIWDRSSARNKNVQLNRDDLEKIAEEVKSTNEHWNSL